MKFLIELTAPQTPHAIQEQQEREYDDELDDIRSIIHDICATLEGVPGIELRVAVCTETLWPVTVATDLCVIMEQIGDVIRDLSLRTPARLDFYEQGIERSVLLKPADDLVVVVCAPLAGAEGQVSDTTTVSAQGVLSCLRSLTLQFLHVSRLYCPKATAHPWFVEWSRGLESMNSY